MTRKWFLLQNIPISKQNLYLEVDTLFMTKTAEKPHPLGHYLNMSGYSSRNKVCLPANGNIRLSLFSASYEQARRFLAAPPWPQYMSRPGRTYWKRKKLIPSGDLINLRPDRLHYVLVRYRRYQPRATSG